MPRTVEITVPSLRTEQIADPLYRLDGVISVRVQAGISRMPPGDVISATVTDHGLPTLMQTLDRAGVLSDPDCEVITARPDSVVSSKHGGLIASDVSRATWEELDNTVNSASTMSLATMMAMALAGLVMAVGILADALHVVLGAVVIVPAFEPLSRMALAAVGGGMRPLRRGLVQTAKGYSALLLGAIVGTLISQYLLTPPVSTVSSYLPNGSLLAFWSATSAASIVVSVAAGIAGAILLITLRSILTLGVTIILVLVPVTTLIGIGLATGDLELAIYALLRLLLEIIIVVGATVVVFLIKKRFVERREASI